MEIENLLKTHQPFHLERYLTGDYVETACANPLCGKVPIEIRPDEGLNIGDGPEKTKTTTSILPDMKQASNKSCSQKMFDMNLNDLD